MKKFFISSPRRARRAAGLVFFFLCSANGLWAQEEAELPKAGRETLSSLSLGFKPWGQKQVEKAQEALVALVSLETSGSGVLVSSEGLIVSAAHVVGEVGSLRVVILKDGSFGHARVLVSDKGRDLAFLAMETPKGQAKRTFPFVPLCAGEVKAGDFVYALGHTMGCDPVRGSVLRMGKVLTVGAEVMESDATLLVGDSGGALFNTAGELVAVHSQAGDHREDNKHIPLWVGQAFSEPQVQTLLKGLKKSPEALQRLEPEDRQQGERTLALWEPVRGSLQEKSLVLYGEDKEIVACGTWVSTRGHFLTKASEVSGKAKLSARYKSRLFTELMACGVDEQSDLALFQIKDKGQELVVEKDALLPWCQAASLGDLVLVNGANTRSQRLGRWGIVGAAAYALPEKKGLPVLGIIFEEESPLKVQEMLPKLTAFNSPLLKGDTLVSVEGQKLQSPLDLVPFLFSRFVGDPLTLQIEREGKLLEMELRLLGAPPSSASVASLGKVNARRDSLPLSYSHSTPLAVTQMGGPLLNTSGECLGVNIARVNKVETYALTLQSVREALGRMLQASGIKEEGFLLLKEGKL